MTEYKIIQILKAYDFIFFLWAISCFINLIDFKKKDKRLSKKIAKELLNKL